VIEQRWYLYTFSKNNVISSVQIKNIIVLLGLGLEMGLAEIRFRASVVYPSAGREQGEQF